MPKALGIDFGEKRVGIAISNSTKSLAIAKETLSYSNAIERIKKLVEENEIDEVVVGLPLTLRGVDSTITLKAKKFYNLLKTALSPKGIKVVLFDERLSSKIASRISYIMGYNKKEVIDQISAQLILQDYLDSKR